MAPASPIRILIAADHLVSSASIAGPLESAGLSYEIREVSSRDSFLSTLESFRPNLVLVSQDGMPDLALADVLGIAENIQPPIPAVVISGDPRQEHSAVRTVQQGTATYLQMSQMERLPSIIERAGVASAPEVAAEAEREKTASSNTQLRSEVEHAAHAMRENQKLVTIGRLASSIAHEINNPLESITNLLFLMEEEPELPERVRQYLGLAQKELGRVVQISKQTLNFYRETPSAVLTFLGDLLDEVLVLYARRIAEKQIEVIRQFDTDEAVMTFPGETRQVFSNLIANAIEASLPDGKLYLRLRSSRLWGDSGVLGVRVTIADTGTGIPVDVRRHIGEPFMTTKGQAGTGLGLWVVRSIVKRYGGTMTLRSSVGKRHGTVFSILLPTNLRPRAVGDGDDSRPHSGRSKGSGSGNSLGTQGKRFRSAPAVRHAGGEGEVRSQQHPGENHGYLLI